MMMAFTRAAAMFYFIPIFSESSIPKMAKVALPGLFAIALAPVIVSQASIPTSLLGLILAFAGELLIGSLLGFSVKILFYAVQVGTSILAVQAALMRSRAFDPITQQPGSVMTPLFMYLAVVVFCALGTHLEVFAAFVYSYELAPAGLGIFGMGSMMTIIKATSGIFVVGLSMAAPLIAFAFVVNILVGILGRVASKFNILVLSFAFRILGGLLIIFFSVRLILSYIVNGIEGTGLNMLEFLVR